VEEAVKTIAKVKSISGKEVEKVTEANARRIFDI
jgi:Tat protein secretion system quality control protein TatD with DNase activity